MHSYLTYMCPQYVTFGLMETAYHITVFCLFVCLFFKAQNSVITVFDGFRDFIDHFTARNILCKIFEWTLRLCAM